MGVTSFGSAIANNAKRQRFAGLGTGDKLLGERGRTRIVQARDQEAARHDAVGELLEDLPVGRFRLEVIQVVGLDVRDHRDLGRVGQEGAVGLVGLGHENLACAVVGIRARTVQLAADGERGILPRGLQRRHGHRRRRGLAVRTRQQESTTILQQQRQDVGAAEHRNACLAGADEFRIILRNRGEGGDDHRRRLPQQAQILLCMPDLDLRAGRAQRHDAARLLHVRPADLVAAVQQDAGDTGHAGTADAHHVHAGEVRGLRLLAHRGRCLSGRRGYKEFVRGARAKLRLLR